jgi:putative endonuclease
VTAPRRPPTPAPPCFIYILGSVGAPRRLTYVGWTTDMDKRLARHNAGKGARFTRGRQWELLYLEEAPDKREAMSREWHLKRDRDFRRRVAQSFPP